MTEAARQADPDIHWWPYAQALDPVWALSHTSSPEPPMQTLWINHHDGLHSRWTPEHITTFQARGVKVLLTYHDTRETLVDCPKLGAMAVAADHTIVHEPVAGLTDVGRFDVTYLRQGILPFHGPYFHEHRWAVHGLPVLGTAGFDFPWKNYDRLAELTQELGWAFVLYCNNLTEERHAQLTAINPLSRLYSGFRPASEVIAGLAGCTASAFMYECANTGTSGAIRLGIAARKPVFAFKGCRQFRDLVLEDEGDSINWAMSWPHLRTLLRGMWPVDFDPGIVHLAHRDSMAKVGAHYAKIIRGL